MKSIKLFVLGLVGFVTSFFGMAAHAAAPDYTTLTTAVDFTAVGAAILVVLAAVAGLYVLWRGGKMIVSAIKSA